MDSGAWVVGALLLACTAAGYVVGTIQATRKGAALVRSLGQRWGSRVEALARALPPSMHAVKDELRAIIVEADIAQLNASEVLEGQGGRNAPRKGRNAPL